MFEIPLDKLGMDYPLSFVSTVNLGGKLGLQNQFCSAVNQLNVLLFSHLELFLPKKVGFVVKILTNLYCSNM